MKYTVVHQELGGCLEHSLFAISQLYSIIRLYAICLCTLEVDKSSCLLQNLFNIIVSYSFFFLVGITPAVILRIPRYISISTDLLFKVTIFMSNKMCNKRF